MALNKQKGNMYPWVTHTWNVVKGKCPHDCSYCYMKVYPQKELYFCNSEILTKLGEGNFIFVGSSCDMWAKEIPEVWINAILWRCMEDPKNTYLFQSKNPARFREFKGLFPSNFMLGTTIESNYNLLDSCNAPNVYERMKAMSAINHLIPKMVSIEPIMDFDVDILLDWIRQISPKFVSIGADSKGHNLPEPSGEKVRQLIAALKDITEIRCKNNLSRLLNPNPSNGG